MPELRREPVSGRWVIIATERAERPTDFKTNPQIIKSSFCPFCEGNEDKTPPEIMANREKGTEANTRGWRVRVVPNKFPALQIEGEQNKRGEGIYDMMNGIGAHEVIIESPKHIQSLTALENGNVEEVLSCYRDRLIDLKKDKRFVYGLLFKNVGSPAVASCGGSGLDEFASLSTRNRSPQDATENYLQSRDRIQALCGGTCRARRA